MATMLNMRWIVITGVRLFAAALLLGLAGCAASDQTATVPPAAPGPVGGMLAAAEIRGIQVELMVFSGRPNPRWSLLAEEQEQARELLAGAALRTAQPIEGRLGYSGFNLTLQTATEPITVWIYDEVIMSSESGGVVFYRDDRRGLERLLLETGKPHIDPALYQSISDTIPEQ